jgi:hypothetical protein
MVLRTDKVLCVGSIIRNKPLDFFKKTKNIGKTK